MMEIRIREEHHIYKYIYSFHLQTSLCSHDYQILCEISYNIYLCGLCSHITFVAILLLQIGIFHHKVNVLYIIQQWAICNNQVKKLNIEKALKGTPPCSLKVNLILCKIQLYRKNTSDDK
jgi:hypothetical protein